MILGSLNLVAAGAAWMLPETAGNSLSDSLSDSLSNSLSLHYVYINRQDIR